MVSVADFHQAFLEAEEAIKYAELTVDSFASIEDADCQRAYQPRGVVVPSINELRYAAKHLSCAVQEGVPEEEREEQLRRAIRHCVRAKLDALKAVVLFLARDFRQFSADYRLLHIDNEDRDQLNVYRQKYKDVLSLLSKNRSEDADEICKKLKNGIDELQVIYLQVTQYRGKFNQLLGSIEQIKRQAEEKEKQAERRGKIDRWIGIIVALLGITIGLIF